MSQDLITKLEAAMGPDRELDHAVFMALAAFEESNYWHPKVGNHWTQTAQSRAEAIAILKAKEASR